MKERILILLRIFLVVLIVVFSKILDFNIKDKLYQYDNIREKYGLQKIPDNVRLHTYRHEELPIFYIEYKDSFGEVVIEKNITFPKSTIDFKSGESDKYFINQDTSIIVWHYYWNKKMKYSVITKGKITPISKDECFQMLEKYKD